MNKEAVDVRECRKARASVEHPAHEWIAGEYLPVGDLGYAVQCPGFQREGGSADEQ